MDDLHPKNKIFSVWIPRKGEKSRKEDGEDEYYARTLQEIIDQEIMRTNLDKYLVSAVKLFPE